MFTVNDLVERYGVSEDTVLHWIRSGELKALNVGAAPGKKKPRWRMTQAALDAFEAARAATPAPERKQRRPQPAGVVQFYK